MEGTFHRRELKAPSISFGSPEGKEIFRRALAEGNMEGYFNLAEHFVTQGHPAFCGIGSLTMALNSLLLDPQRVWQGVWRWFDESMLDCCEPLDIVRVKGITLPKLSCLARCNGAHSTLIYGDEVTVEEFRKDVILISTLATGAKKQKCCGMNSCTTGPTTAATTDNAADSSVPIARTNSSIASCCDRSALIDSSARPLREPVHRDAHNVMICSYSRPGLNQSGSGHFSPIGGYCAERDLVLILDVARFKYPPHWVPLAALHKAMQAVDPETGRCRGYILLSASKEMERKCRCAEGCSKGNNTDSTTSTTSTTDTDTGTVTGTGASTAADTDTAVCGVASAGDAGISTNIDASLDAGTVFASGSSATAESNEGDVNADAEVAQPTSTLHNMLAALTQHSCPFC